MVIIHESQSSMFVSTSRRIAYCPHCKNMLAFYSVSPKECHKCGKGLVDYINILTNNTYKINYHFEIIDECGNVSEYM